MNCGSCGHANRDIARFCASCGERLAARCASCGAELPDGARFCDGCGASVDAAPSGARKVVTIVFADLAGSTPLHERMDPESVRRVMDGYYAAMRADVEAHGGRVVKLQGDGVMAAFGIPDVREDDALRAVRAAAAMQRSFRSLELPDVDMRVGVNTGEVVVTEGNDDVVGDAVNVASRLESAAGAGGVLVGEETWRLVRGHLTLAAIPPLELKGKTGPVAAFRLMSLEGPADSSATPFVGREHDLSRLHEVFEDAATRRCARIASVVGSPGVGKSRLAHELALGLAPRARVIEARCEQAGSSTFAPLTDALRQAGLETDADVAKLVAQDPDADRVVSRAAALFGTGAPASPEETFWAVRRVFEALARGVPLVLVIDDIHWAEPMLLDLIEHLAEWTRGVPVLFLVLARPEIRELRPSLAEGPRVVRLEGLPPEASVRLALDLIGADELPPALLDRLLESSGGNPLFVRELVRMLVEDGVLRRTDAGWTVTVDASQVDVPPTIHALLSARIDRLRADERIVLERASVIGKQFYRGALTELCGLPGGVDAQLEALRRRELVEPEGTYWIDEPVWRFHHVLIRDAAYRRLLKESRAELHERFASWLESKGTEDDEVVGYHLEQAHEYRRQLGTLDERAEGIGRRAAELLHAAGRRALERDDLPASASLLGRALERLEPGGPLRPLVLIDRCEALLAMGDAASASGAVAELSDAAGDDPRLRAWADCFTGQLATMSDPGSLRDSAGRASAAAARFEDLGDSRGAAKAHHVHAQALHRLGEVAASQTALDRALAAARSAHDNRRSNACLAGVPVASLWGPIPVTRASGHCLDVVRVLRITTGAPAVEATALRCQAVLEALRGRFDAARRMLASARASLEELGLRHGLLETDAFSGFVEHLAGDPTTAEQRLRSAYEGFRELGADIDAAQSAALLGSACLLQGRDAEALEWTRRSEELGGDDLKSSILWRAVRGAALAVGGDHHAAIALSREAVAIAERTDALVDHADARRSLAIALRAAGRDSEADDEARRALELYERKGATAAADRARTLLGENAPQVLAPTDHANTDVLRIAPGVDPPEAALAYWREFVESTRSGLLGSSARDFFAPDFELVDHRRGLRSEIHGRDQYMDAMASVMRDGELVHIDVLAHIGDAVLMRVHIRGTTTTGGEFERVTIVVARGTPDWRLITSLENYDEEDLPSLLTTFAGPTARDQIIDATAERNDGVPTNTVVRTLERLRDALTAEDYERLESLHAAGYQLEDRRPIFATGARTTRSYLASLRTYGELGIAGGHMTLLATRGDRLALSRSTLIGTNAGGGPAEIELLAVNESGPDGRLTRSLFFAADAIEDAVDALDDWYLDGEAAPYAGVWAQLRKGLRSFRNRDAGWMQWPDEFVFVDHRRLGLGTRVGPAAEAERVEAMLELAPDLTLLVEAVEALRPHGTVLRVLATGTRDGGPFEAAFYRVDVLRDGEVVRLEYFPIDARDAAVARLDELEPRDEVPPNAAVRAVQRRGDAWSAQDWEVVTACHTPDCWSEDHRPTLAGGARRDRAYTVRAFRDWQDLGFTLAAHTTIATRGDRVALTRSSMSGTNAEGGEIELVVLAVSEVRADGRLSRTVLFGPGDVGAALDVLDDWYAEGEAGAHPELWQLVRDGVRFTNERDWTSYRRYLSDDYVLVDHRPMGWGTVTGPDAELDLRQGLTELAPDWSLFMECCELAPHGAAGRFLATGTRDDGPFELAFCRVDVVRDGKDVRCEFFPADAWDEARARLAELAQPRRAVRSNAATRWLDRWAEAMRSGDLVRIRDLYSDDFVLQHHVFRTVLDLEQTIAAHAGRIAAPDFSFTSTPLATLGDRLVVRRLRETWTGVDDVGPAEVEAVAVVLVDTGATARRIELFPPEDLHLAVARLFELHAEDEATDPPAALRLARRFRDFDSVNDRDWDRFASSYHEDVVLVDHQRAGFGTVSGRAALVEHQRAMVELAPDARWRLADVLALTDLALAAETVIEGTDLAGSRFEIRALLVTVGDAGGIRHIERFSTGEREAALARFSDIAVRGGVAANAAVRALDHRRAAWRADDWDAVRACHNDDFSGQDRRRALGGSVTRDVQQYMQSFREWRALGFSDGRTTTIATRGDRVALVRLVMSGVTSDGGQSELDLLMAAEVRGDGLLSRTVAFDPDDLDAALDLIDEWFGEGEAAAYADLWNGFRRGRRMWAERDWTSVRAGFADDLVAVDHRPMGWGTRVGGDAEVERMQAMIDLAPDSAMVLESVDAIAPHGFVIRYNVTGTQDGSAFELPYYAVRIIDGGRHTRVEYFSVDDRDAALARFAELAPTGDFLPTNATVRTLQRAASAVLAGDFEAYRDLWSADGWVEDRRGLFGGTRRDREHLVSTMRAFWELGMSAWHVEPIATRGDRLSLDRSTLVGRNAEGGETEVVGLGLNEIGDDGRFTRLVMFGVDALEEALEELDEWFAAGEASGFVDIWTAARVGVRAYNARDWDAYLSVQADDLVQVDHRPLGWGTRVGLAAELERARAMVALAPDTVLRWETIETIASHGFVARVRSAGTRDGGPFIRSYYVVNILRDGLLVRGEFFDGEARDAAFVRFAELTQ